MWPFRKRLIYDVSASKAVAYLKVTVPADDDAPAFELPHEDSPVLTDIGTRLFVSYVVDVADSFRYIQYREI